MCNVLNPQSHEWWIALEAGRVVEISPDYLTKTRRACRVEITVEPGRYWSPRLKRLIQIPVEAQGLWESGDFEVDNIFGMEELLAEELADSIAELNRIKEVHAA
ncbi:hypothetical protein [Neptuniibacter sp. QD37_11]|uniref:hypothetical protein n=1 Tax=Neptuniibacter sp. QD37_11 TaxID=3398209 RepID=UPI0039F5E4ED